MRTILADIPSWRRNGSITTTEPGSHSFSLRAVRVRERGAFLWVPFLSPPLFTLLPPPQLQPLSNKIRTHHQSAFIPQGLYLKARMRILQEHAQWMGIRCVVSSLPVLGFFLFFFPIPSSIFFLNQPPHPPTPPLRPYARSHRFPSRGERSDRAGPPPKKTPQTNAPNRSVAPKLVRRIFFVLENVVWLRDRKEKTESHCENRGGAGGGGGRKK